MKMLLGIAIAIAFAAPARGTMDPAPNSIGVYFDLDATTNYLDVGVSEIVDVYVSLTNPTELSIAGAIYKHRIEVIGSGSYPVLLMSISDYCGDGCIYGGACGDPCMGNPPDPYDRNNYQWFIGLGHPPIPSSESVVLLSFQIMFLEVAELRFFIEPVSGDPYFPDYEVPVYLDVDWNEYPLGVSSGSYDIPVAEINTGNRPVAEERSSWGAVKAQYR